MHLADETSTAKPAVVWSLVGVWGDGQPARKVALGASQCVVGRLEDADLRLDFGGVSKRHSCLRLVADQLYVKDLGSTNGTFVNGRRIAEETLLQPGDIVQFANAPFHVSRDALIEPQCTQAEQIVDHAMALLQFDRLMSQRAVTPHFQPIVTIAERTIVAFEVLARSQVLGLETAQVLFETASLVQQEVELSRLLREEALRIGLSNPRIPELFLNTHPAEAEDDRLIPSLRDLRHAFPHTPMALEIHEFAVTDLTRMRAIQRELRSLKIKLAYDDFGSGQARLVELVEVPPDYLKFDRGLIQGICTAPEQRQQMLGTLVRMARDLGIVTLAEGVETAEDSQVCEQLGFELGQGYFYGRPEALGNWNRVTNAACPFDSRKA
jgi:EAL domain-containing protein (putative c-di-GMP-specific phosphodiesterase class I)